MKLLMFTIVAGTAAAAEEGLFNSSSRRRDKQTTKDLELATQQFIEANLGKRKLANTVNSNVVSGKRSLRSSSTRRGRGGKSNKVTSSSDSSSSLDSYYGKGGKTSGFSGRGSGKSGKLSDDYYHEELFYLLPTACPHECITSNVSEDNDEFIDSIKQCEEGEETHQWLVQSDGSYITIESYHSRDMCIAVEYESDDTEAMLAETCYNGELVLRDCDSKYGIEWYFTGGQLVNSLCWGAGLPSMMTVFLDPGDPEEKVQTCVKDVAVWGGNNDSLYKADTFMFVNRLPEVPFHIDDVNGALQGNVEGQT